VGEAISKALSSKPATTAASGALETSPALHRTQHPVWVTVTTRAACALSWALECTQTCLTAPAVHSSTALGPSSPAALVRCSTQPSTTATTHTMSSALLSRSTDGTVAVGVSLVLTPSVMCHRLIEPALHSVYATRLVRAIACAYSMWCMCMGMLESCCGLAWVRCVAWVVIASALRGVPHCSATLQVVCVLQPALVLHSTSFGGGMRHA
jgi:hypothetical protein